MTMYSSLRTEHAVFSITYLGPISWYASLLQHPNARIEQHEHYRKQSWRNRCMIDGADKPQVLSIPVIAPNHTKINEVRIQYAEPWQRLHWRTITASYSRSPFFEHYADRFRPFFEQQQFDLLIDFNVAIMKVVFDLLRVQQNITLTETFEQKHDNDFRDIFSPKRSLPENFPFHPAPYLQVFSDRHPFLPDLSILDLLFCAGPESAGILRNSI